MIGSFNRTFKPTKEEKIEDEQRLQKLHRNRMKEFDGKCGICIYHKEIQYGYGMSYEFVCTKYGTSILETDDACADYEAIDGNLS